MKLLEKSIEWAIVHNTTMKDTDLFPLPKEIKIMGENIEECLKKFKDIDISNHKWSSARRYLIPKKEMSYRMATQLDPLDSILFSSIIYEYGDRIEDRRIPLQENKVFSYRFSPNKLGYMYTLEDSWKNFWTHANKKMQNYNYAVTLDISDFYNQIYHHTVENELIASKFPNAITKSLVSFLSEITAKTSRGIPVGPHASHLLAEMTMIPLDDFLSIKNYDYCRYADDIIIFSQDLVDVEKKVFEVAEFIDSNQRLVLNSSKTKIYKRNEFVGLCIDMIRDNPINDLEEEMVNVLNKYDVNLYSLSSIIKLDADDLNVFTEEKIRQCLDSYLHQEDANFIRIKWLYRRLSQIRVDTAVNYTIDNLTKLTPAISEIINYFISIGESEDCTLDLNIVGDSIFKIYDSKLVKCNPYLQMSLISLFSNSKSYNHITMLMDMYSHSTEDVKREILLACYESGNTKGIYGWIYGLKEQSGSYNAWTRRAYIIATTMMLPENKKFYFKNRDNQRGPLENFLIDWAKKQ